MCRLFHFVCSKKTAAKFPWKVGTTAFLCYLLLQFHLLDIKHLKMQAYKAVTAKLLVAMTA